jgi:hypothetical protein
MKLVMRGNKTVFLAQKVFTPLYFKKTFFFLTDNPLKHAIPNQTLSKIPLAL